MNLNKIFDRLFISSEIGFKKPEKEFFDYIMKYIGNIKKEEILFWDDKPHFVEKALEYGLRSELFTKVHDFENKMRLYVD